MRMARRSVLSGLLAGSAGLALPVAPALASNPNGIRCGAIRWDAWYNNVPGRNSWYAQHNLDFPHYQLRAPFFAQQVSPHQMSIYGQQSHMDAEIAYAVSGKIAYFAFLAYDPASADGDFLNGFNLFQSSASKNSISWCWIYTYTALTKLRTAGSYAPLIAQLQQPNYETCLSKRPLLYLLVNGDNLASTVAPAIVGLRSACSAAGLGTPYVVLMGAVASDVATAGADAISDYAYSTNTTYGPYTELASAVEALWDTRKAEGTQVIPVCMSGWDRRPRIEHPVPWEVAGQGQRSYVGMSNSFATATPAQIAAHVKAAINWIGNNPSVCPSKRTIIYAWNEFDEGGWICPTWTASGPDHSRLDALANVL